MPTNSKLAGKMPLMMGLMGSAGKPLPVQTAESIDFDGSNDYLSRSSDLTSNTDGKTFTFSTWFYSASTQNATAGLIWNTSGRFGVGMSSTGRGLSIRALTSADGWLLDAGANAVFALETWNHLLVSIDLDNASNRYVYLNDSDITSSVTWSTYTSGDISFTEADWFVASSNGGATQRNKGRQAHCLLDYDYLDLSIEANRRFFIDADGYPSSGQADLSPILYLPMTDPDTVQVNSGTGGDFTLNGTVARSGRGPNQDNCSASDLDGANDYLLLTPSAFSDSEFSTVAFTLRADTVGVNQYVMQIMNAAAGETHLRVQIDNSGVLYFYSRDVTAATNSYIATTPLVAGVNNHVVFQIDLSSGSVASDSKCYINGGLVTLTNTAFINTSTIAYGDGSKPANRISVGGSNVGGSYTNGAIGEVFVDVTAIIPIESLWDSELGKPIPMINAIDNGLTPLVALPMIGSDAGNNLGTGGDFTVNSGPFTGARGASEFWARGIDLNGTSQYLNKTSALTGATATNKFTLVFAFYIATTNQNGMVFEIRDTVDTDSFFQVTVNSGANSIAINGIIDNAWGLSVTTAATINNTGWHTVAISCDLSDTAKRSVLMDRVTATPTWTQYVDGNLKFNLDTTRIGAGGATASSFWYDYLGFIYFDDVYTDFTDEATLDLFIDQLNYPRDLPAAIEAGDVPDPLVYMKFEDTTDLGVNSGTGGNYTEVASPIAGPDVNP